MMTRVRRNFMTVVVAILVLGLCQSAFALSDSGMGARSLTTVDGDVFLGGDYIELGISAAGSFGTASEAPTKSKPDSTGVYFHPNSTDVGSKKIGLRSNSQGWETNGTQNPDETKDFFLPGLIDEGFLIGWATSPNDSASTKAVASEFGKSNRNISNASTMDESTAELLQATTTGKAGAGGEIEYTQVVSFHPDDKVFRTDITLKNVSGSPLHKLTYVRRFDPDQNVKSNTYETDNFFLKDEAGIAWTIASTAKLTSPAETRLTAIDRQKALTAARNTFSFFANDRRAESTYGNLGFTDIPAANYTGDSIYGKHRWGDVSIGHLTNLGTLNHNQSVTFTYYSSLDPNIFSAISSSEDVTIGITLQPVFRTFVKGYITGTLRVLGEKLIQGKAYTDLTYQWYRGTGMTPENGTAISGATGWDFEIPSGLDEGVYDYYCVVSDPGSGMKATSKVARITIVPVDTMIYTVNFDANLTDATVTRMPAKQTVASGGSLLDQGVPSAKGYIFNGWFLEKDCITPWDFNDTVSASFTLYAGWTLTQLDITLQPSDQSVTQGQTATFVIAATGEGLQYQWYTSRYDGAGWTKLQNATDTSYTTPVTNAQSNGVRYRCRVTNAYGREVDSEIAVVHVTRLGYATTPVTTPQTGDRSTPLLWISLGLLSGMGALVLLRVRRKHA